MIKMSISLLKESQESIQSVLLQKKLDNFVAEVNFIIDTSGSTNGLFAGGDDSQMQMILTKIFAISTMVDPDKKMKANRFSFSASSLPDVNMNNFNHYMNQYVRKHVGGGTCYSHGMKKMLQQFPPTNDKLTINIVFTDGENSLSDDECVDKILQDTSGEYLFWIFVCLGNSDFTRVKRFKKLSNRYNQNVDCIDVNRLGDREFSNNHIFFSKVFDMIPNFISNFKYKPIKKSFFSKVKDLFL
jgi:hypothetical protein